MTAYLGRCAKPSRHDEWTHAALCDDCGAEWRGTESKIVRQAKIHNEWKHGGARKTRIEFRGRIEQ